MSTVSIPPLPLFTFSNHILFAAGLNDFISRDNNRHVRARAVYNKRQNGGNKRFFSYIDIQNMLVP